MSHFLMVDNTGLYASLSTDNKALADKLVADGHTLSYIAGSDAAFDATYPADGNGGGAFDGVIITWNCPAGNAVEIIETAVGVLLLLPDICDNFRIWSGNVDAGTGAVDDEITIDDDTHVVPTALGLANGDHIVHTAGFNHYGLTTTLLCAGAQSWAISKITTTLSAAVTCPAGSDDEFSNPFPGHRAWWGYRYYHSHATSINIAAKMAEWVVDKLVGGSSGRPMGSLAGRGGLSGSGGLAGIGGGIAG